LVSGGKVGFDGGVSSNLMQETVRDILLTNNK
jgi:hypothetical protein